MFPNSSKVKVTLRLTITRSVCLGVKALLGSMTRFLLLSTVAGLYMWGALSDGRTGLSFTIASVPRQPVILGSESLGSHNHILFSQVLKSLNLDGQVLVFLSPMTPRHPGLLFVASYNYQGYGGVIGTRLQGRRSKLFTTDGQSVSISWYRAPLLDLWPDITSCRNVAVWNLRSCFCRAPSLTRGRVCSLQCNHSMFLVA
jgi:hypothetical protein